MKAPPFIRCFILQRSPFFASSTIRFIFAVCGPTGNTSTYNLLSTYGRGNYFDSNKSKCQKKENSYHFLSAGGSVVGGGDVRVAQTSEQANGQSD